MSRRVAQTCSINCSALITPMPICQSLSRSHFAIRRVQLRACRTVLTVHDSCERRRQQQQQQQQQRLLLLLLQYYYSTTCIVTLGLQAAIACQGLACFVVHIRTYLSDTFLTSDKLCLLFWPRSTPL